MSYGTILSTCIAWSASTSVAFSRARSPPSARRSRSSAARRHGKRSRVDDLRFRVHTSACGPGLDRWPQRADGPSWGGR
jgi:hypothetical protein